MSVTTHARARSSLGDFSNIDLEANEDKQCQPHRLIWGVIVLGIATSPELTHEMLEGVKEFLPTSAGDESVIGRVREGYAKDAEPLGSVPPPATLTGVAKTAVRGVRGAHPTQFIDKLGERLGFERFGVRLYEALLSKSRRLRALHGRADSRGTREHPHGGARSNFRLLTDAVTKVGGDPTVMTPSADLHATMSYGVLAVMVDARTTLAQCLEAALLAELADNEGWEALVELATQNGEEELAARF